MTRRTTRTIWTARGIIDCCSRLRTSKAEAKAEGEMQHREPIATSLDNETDEYTRMLLAIALYNPPPDIAHAIKEAYDSKEWDWKLCDGCSASTQLHSPPGTKFWPCVRHDYDYWRARNAKTIGDADKIAYEGDKLLYRSSRAFGATVRASFRRFYGPRLYWLFWERWFWRPPPRLNIKLK